MPVVPVQTSAEPSAQYLALYRATLQEAAGGGGVLMSRMIAAGPTGVADQRAESARQLSERETDLCTAYPKALLEAFSNPEMAGEAAALFNLDLQFDQLELMGEDEVMTNVLIARTRHAGSGGQSGRAQRLDLPDAWLECSAARKQPFAAPGVCQRLECGD